MSTLKNKLLSEANFDSKTLIEHLKKKDFKTEGVNNSCGNIVFMKKRDNFVCFLFFFSEYDHECKSNRYTDLVFSLYEDTENGYKGWSSVYGKSQDKEAAIVRNFFS